MASGDSLPERERVVRGCARKGFVDGEFVPAAFALKEREMEVKRISSDRVECPYVAEHKRTPEGSVERLKAIPVGGPYALLAVSEIRRVKYRNFALDVIELGNEKNRCHCTITGFSGTHEDLALQTELAELANRLPALF